MVIKCPSPDSNGKPFCAVVRRKSLGMDSGKQLLTSLLTSLLDCARNDILGMIIYKSKPSFTPNLVAMIFVILCFNSGILMLSITAFENAYISNALASFLGIPRDCM